MLWQCLRHWLRGVDSKYETGHTVSMSWHLFLEMRSGAYHILISFLFFLPKFSYKSENRPRSFQMFEWGMLLNLPSTLWFLRCTNALVVAVFISIICAVWCVSMKDGVTVCAPAATITALQIYRCNSGQGLCLTLDTATLPHDKINSWESTEILGNMSSVCLVCCAL